MKLVQCPQCNGAQWQGKGHLHHPHKPYRPPHVVVIGTPYFNISCLCGAVLKRINVSKQPCCYTCKMLRRSAAAKITGPQYRMRKRLEKLEQLHASRP